MTPDPSARKPNRLIHENSPYLLQHAYNPVEWYPWGPEALARSKREDKPVFLSIGYSTCYWCHVMEQESFEHPEIAAEINARFVPVKVDREERPDLDALYMGAVMAMTGQGGWPMTVFLTPEGAPFWGGTYFPPEDRQGRPGIRRVLRAVSDAWQQRRAELLRSARQLTQALQQGAQLRAGGAAEGALSPELFELAVAQYAEQFDAARGGFGPAPKFPRSHVLSFLLRAWTRSPEPKTLAMVRTTLDAMARGGICDQLGGGFHRYATDADWLVPHFEKMLYDQALISRAYLEAYQATKAPEYAQVAREAFAYVLRDLRAPEGGFYAAEDAGAVGREGAFYVWSAREIAQLLTPEEAELIRRHYDVTQEGNFAGEGGPAGANILSIRAGEPTPAEQAGSSLSQAGALLASARAKLLVARDRRPRPHRDDKVLTDWNGLMIGALAFGARVLDEPSYAQAAGQAARFVLGRLQRDGRLLHRYRDGSADIAGFLDDYAFMAWGLLDLYEATFEVRWLEEAMRLTEEMARGFWDEAEGGFFFSGEQNERLIARTKELYDGAVPSGNSVAALVLGRLSHLTFDERLRRRAARCVQAFTGALLQMAHPFPQALIALDVWLGPAQELVIAGDPDAPQTRRMLRAINSRFLPRSVMALHPGGAAGRRIESLVPLTRDRRPSRDTHVYVCEDQTCRLPVSDPDQLGELLDQLR